MKTIFLLLSVLSLLASCGNRERIAQLEKEKAELELSIANIEQTNQSLRNQNYEIQTQNQQLTSQNEVMKQQLDEDTWKYYGSVTLYGKRRILFTGSDEETIQHVGNGSVYVKHSEFGDQYELRYSLGDKDYSYHVAVGRFTLCAGNEVSQFSAHAGEYYFDL